MKFQNVCSFILTCTLLIPFSVSAQKVQSDNLKIQRQTSGVINNFNKPKNINDLETYAETQKEAQKRQQEKNENSLDYKIKKAVKEAELKNKKKINNSGTEAFIVDNSKIKLVGLDQETVLKRQEEIINQLCKETKEVRLDNPGYALSNMTDTVQIAGTCYAHAAAQLYDAYRILYPPEQNFKYHGSSISHISYLYKTYGVSSGINPEGGDTRDVLNILKNQAPCPRDSIAIPDKESVMDLFEIKIDKAYKQLCTLKDQFGHCSDSNTSTADLKTLQKKYDQLCSLIKSPNSNLMNQSKNLKDIVEVINTSNILKVAHDAQAFTCETTNKSQKYDTFRLNVTEQNRIERVKMIMSMLDRPAQKNLPLQLSFCSRRVYSPAKNQSCGDHAITIIGKRFNKEKKTCEFYVHDSGYPSSLNAKAITNENVKSQKMWINAHQLMTHAKSIVTIEPLKSMKSPTAPKK